MKIKKKVQTCCFFILYDHINFYEHVYNVYIFNYEVQIHYVARYIYFIYLSNFLKDKSLGDDLLEHWYNQYLSISLIDRATVKKLYTNNFIFSFVDFWFRVAIIQYTISEVLGYYFIKVMQKLDKDK